MAATPKVIEPTTHTTFAAKRLDICSNVKACRTIKASLFHLISRRHADSLDLDCPVTSGTQKEAI